MAVAFQVGACTAEDNMMLVYTTATDVLVNGFVLYQKQALPKYPGRNIRHQAHYSFIKRMAV